MSKDRIRRFLAAMSLLCVVLGWQGTVDPVEARVPSESFYLPPPIEYDDEEEGEKARPTALVPT